jgi:hypothetical protein
MQDEDDLSFVIPTHRLRDVGETVEQYDEHFWRNGHSPQIIVFDDSTPANQEKYFPLLEKTKTHHDLYYVGPREKEQFLAYLNGRLRDKRLESLIKSLFRPSYGGNRNHPLMYTTLGHLEGFAQSLVEDGLAPISRARTLAAVKSLFGFCQRMRYDSPALWKTFLDLCATGKNREINRSRG